MQPLLRRGTPGALHLNSAKCHTKSQQDPYQHLLLILVSMRYWSSNSVYSEVQVFIRFTHRSSRTSGEKELMLSSLSQPSQVTVHHYSVKLLIIPSLVHCSNNSSLKKNAQPQKLKLPAPDIV